MEVSADNRSADETADCKSTDALIPRHLPRDMGLPQGPQQRPKLRTGILINWPPKPDKAEDEPRSLIILIGCCLDHQVPR